MSQHCCAFLTLEDREGFYVYDEMTFEPLSQLGWSVQEIPWSQTDVDWDQFDLVVIRSTWDYQDRFDEFISVLHAIDSSRAILLNPIDTCVWNSSKEYLRELQQLGVPIVPTIWLDAWSDKVVDDAFETFGANKLVIKPIVGANADDTFVLQKAHSPSRETAAEVFDSSPGLLQPFLNSIVEEGEYSLIYFGDEYSHAIIKKPARGDFRVQEEHGGAIDSYDANDQMIALGRKVLDSVPQRLLYSRIDFARLDDGSLALMEAELIEPSLYFPYDPASPERFAKVLDRTFRERESQI